MVRLDASVSIESLSLENNDSWQERDPEIYDLVPKFFQPYIVC